MAFANNPLSDAHQKDYHSRMVLEESSQRFLFYKNGSVNGNTSSCLLHIQRLWIENSFSLLPVKSERRSGLLASFQRLSSPWGFRKSWVRIARSALCSCTVWIKGKWRSKWELRIRNRDSKRTRDADEDSGATMHQPKQSLYTEEPSLQAKCNFINARNERANKYRT